MVRSHGVAYQADMSRRIEYGSGYFEHYEALRGTPIASAITRGRIDFVNRHHGNGMLVDVGIGSGEFIEERSKAGAPSMGFDINPIAKAWLEKRGLYTDNLRKYPAYSFWDVLEHCEEPAQYLTRVQAGAWVFVSIPIFKSLDSIRESKHYKPGEHLYYWTVEGFLEYMSLWGFRVVEVSDFETRAGRDSIGSFAFRKDLPGYSETVGQYTEMHASRHYGDSAHLYFQQIANCVISANPASILDYGCGRSDLVAYFWNDGMRKVARYDPAIPKYKDMPSGPFDMVLCCDLMEHIDMRFVDRVLAEVRGLSEHAIFSISTKPARAKLPDGRNAHVTLLQHEEWIAWLREYYPGEVKQHGSGWDHILLLECRS